MSLPTFFCLGQRKLIGVHCTHGLNRTGYFICRYLIQKMGLTPADAIQGKFMYYELFESYMLFYASVASVFTITPDLFVTSLYLFQYLYMNSTKYWEACSS